MHPFSGCKPCEKQAGLNEVQTQKFLLELPDIYFLLMPGSYSAPTERVAAC